MYDLLEPDPSGSNGIYLGPAKVNIRVSIASRGFLPILCVSFTNNRCDLFCRTRLDSSRWVERFPTTLFRCNLGRKQFHPLLMGRVIERVIAHHCRQEMDV